MGWNDGSVNVKLEIGKVVVLHESDHPSWGCLVLADLDGLKGNLRFAVLRANVKCLQDDSQRIIGKQLIDGIEQLFMTEELGPTQVRICLLKSVPSSCTKK